MNSPIHEKISPLEAVVPKDRNFGFVFSVVFLLVATFLWWHDYESVYVILFFSLAGIFFSAAIFFPRILHSANMLWYHVGIILHSLISPIILALLFFLIFWPIGVMLRLVRAEIDLQLDFHSGDTYWIKRRSPLDPESFKNQY